VAGLVVVVVVVVVDSKSSSSNNRDSRGRATWRRLVFTTYGGERSGMAGTGNDDLILDKLSFFIITSTSLSRSFFYYQRW